MYFQVETVLLFFVTGGKHFSILLAKLRKLRATLL